MAWHHVFTLIGLGYVQGCVGDYELGLALFRQSLPMCEMLGLTRLRTASLEFLAELLLDLNLWDEAAEFLDLGIELSLRIEINYWLPRLQARLAICRLRQGDLSVESQLQEALEMARSNGQEMQATQCLEGLAELYMAQGEVARAMTHAGELLAMAEKNGMREMVARAHRWQGEAWLAEGRLEEAEEALIMTGELATEIGRVRLEWGVHQALFRLYKTLGRDELARKHQKIVQGIVSQIRENLRHSEMRIGLPA
jgi:tetratricopeptide (TPR) repeat protein